MYELGRCLLAHGGLCVALGGCGASVEADGTRQDFAPRYSSSSAWCLNLVDYPGSSPGQPISRSKTSNCTVNPRLEEGSLDSGLTPPLPLAMRGDHLVGLNALEVQGTAEGGLHPAASALGNVDVATSSTSSDRGIKVCAGALLELGADSSEARNCLEFEQGRGSPSVGVPVSSGNRLKGKRDVTTLRKTRGASTSSSTFVNCVQLRKTVSDGLGLVRQQLSRYAAVIRRRAGLSRKTRNGPARIA